jgi:hypothetical protein
MHASMLSRTSVVDGEEMLGSGDELNSSFLAKIGHRDAPREACRMSTHKCTGTSSSGGGEGDAVPDGSGQRSEISRVSGCALLCR